MNKILTAFLAGTGLVAAAVVAFAAYPAASTAKHRVLVRAELDGSQAVPSVLTTGTGEFTALVQGSQLVRYELGYSGLTGGAVDWVSIHFGQPGVNGGFIAVLCGLNKPPCPPEGVIQGAISATDIRGPAEQGIPSGDLSAATVALTSGNSYIVVRTKKYLPPAGEIRGQIKPAGGKPDTTSNNSFKPKPLRGSA